HGHLKRQSVESKMTSGLANFLPFHRSLPRAMSSRVCSRTVPPNPLLNLSVTEGLKLIREPVSTILVSTVNQVTSAPKRVEVVLSTFLNTSREFCMKAAMEPDMSWTRYVFGA